MQLTQQQIEAIDVQPGQVFTVYRINHAVTKGPLAGTGARRSGKTVWLHQEEPVWTIREYLRAWSGSIKRLETAKAILTTKGELFILDEASQPSKLETAPFNVPKDPYEDLL